ncbi:hypothetical protein [Flavobacterium denitrificans]|uniref:hypothetical protein n=1 Tax=Flavobacterium denitrificans TaxID=281361 RepID=UPI00041B1954|nr:hypothetical protein [Flavobacterium denitrificans]
MEIKTFWRIIIKGIGLWLLINSIYVVPQFASSFSFIHDQLDWGNLIAVWLITFGTLIFYLLIVGVFLFKTEWIVNVLRLDKNFTENRIDINFPYNNVLSIAVIVIGALAFVEAIPKLCSTIYEFLKQKELFRDYSGASWLIFYFLKALVGYLMMTNSKTVVKLIDKRK